MVYYSNKNKQSIQSDHENKAEFESDSEYHFTMDIQQI